MMKVLIVYHAGVMQNARQIYGELVQACDIELSVIVPQRIQTERVYDPTGWLCVEHEENGGRFRLVPVPLRNPSNYGRGFEFRYLQRIMKQVQADIIHVLDEPNSNYLFQIVWQSLIASPHSKVLFYGFQNLPFRLGWRLGPWRLTWTKMAGGVTANSEALGNLRRAGFPKNLPLEHIFWGISTDVFKPMDGVALKKELNLDCEHIVGFVGRFIPEKGISVLQDAMRLLPTTVHCLIIGSGPMRAELEQWSGLSGLSGRIHLYDVMSPEALAKYINCMNVLVVPSITLPHWKEQYGRVIAEAMACGIPVVGSNSGAIPEVIGSAGLIVPEGDSTTLAEAVHDVIFNREAHEGIKQLELKRAEQELSVKVMAGRLLDFYRRILEVSIGKKSYALSNPV
jgi:glycosyltransferase involved in cell wall biosynthesis